MTQAISRLNHISIHTSREGSDGRRSKCESRPQQFQSTLPVGEATSSSASS